MADPTHGMADPTAEGWDEFQSMLEGCDDEFDWERDDKEDCDDEGQDAQRGDPTPDDDWYNDGPAPAWDPERPYFWTPERQPYLTMPTHESPGPAFQAIQWHHVTGDKDTAAAIIIEDFYDNIYRAFLLARGSRRRDLSHTPFPCLRSCIHSAHTHLWSHCPTPNWEWPGPEGLFARQVPQDGIICHFHFYCMQEMDWMHPKPPLETDAMDVDADNDPEDSEGEVFTPTTYTPGAPLFLGGCEECFNVFRCIREINLTPGNTNTRRRVVWLQGHPGGPSKVPHLIQIHREQRTDVHGNTAMWDVPRAMQDPIPGKLPFDRYWAKKGVGPWKAEPNKRKRGRRSKNNKKTSTLAE